MRNDPYFCWAWYESINFHQQTWQNRAPRGELIQNYHIFTHNQYWSVTVGPYFSSRQLSGENDMWLFPGKGPSQRLGDGNGIFNKWPGKLLIIVPFLGLQFLCPESLSNHLRLLVLNKGKQEYWNCVQKNCMKLYEIACCFVGNIFGAFVTMPHFCLCWLFHVSIVCF